MDDNKKLYELNGTKVYFEIGDYYHNPMVMAITAYCEDGEEYSRLSINLGSSTGNNSLIHSNCTFIDTNNVPNVEEFLKSIGAKPCSRFGESIVAYSGFCSYPLYEFSEKLLREMDAEGYEKHLESYRVAFREEQRKMNMEMFGSDMCEQDMSM